MARRIVTRLGGDRVLVLFSIALVFGMFGGFAMKFLRQEWMVTELGAPAVLDFVSFWTAGRFALEGMAANAYDWAVMSDAQARLTGTEGRLISFAYPPYFLFLLQPLALLPYLAAFLVFAIAGLALYAAATAAIVRQRWAAIPAMAAPAVIANIYIGQNGLLSAALFGIALLTLETFPMVSGVALGLLTFKPQIGILFPLVLIVSGHWRVFWTAAGATILAVLASRLAFGPDVYPAFFQSLSMSSEVLLVQGGAGFSEIESLYGLARTLGLGVDLAALMQSAFGLLTTGAVLWLWLKEVPFVLKAAGLSCGALLVTPYVLLYDLAILTIAIAFLRRDGAFDRIEWGTIIAANALVLAMFYQLSSPPPPLPLGFLAPLMIGVLVYRRVRAADRIQGLGDTIQASSWRVRMGLNHRPSD